MKTLKELSLLSPEGWKKFMQFREKRTTGLITGFRGLDESLGGLSGIVGIQGEPGSCKSTMALQIASYNASKAVPVLIVDRENGQDRFRQRLMSQVCGITQAEVYGCSEGKFREYYSRVQKIFSHLYVTTEFQITTVEIKERLQEMQEYHKARQMLLVVDSLQALPKAREDERLALQQWIEALDQLKLDFAGDLVILMTSEKSRGKYEVASKDAGKGTGSIEFKCEQLMDMRADRNTGAVVLQLVKNRDGVCSGDIYFLKQFANPKPDSFVYKLKEVPKEDLESFAKTAQRDVDRSRF